MRPIRLIQTGIILLLAAGTPVLAVLDDRFWFEKRIALAAAAVVLLAFWVIRTWRIGLISPIRPIREIGWLLFATSLLAAAAVPAGRIANLASPELWVGVGAAVVYFIIKSTTTSSKMIKLGFFGVLVGLVVAAGITVSPLGQRFGQIKDLQLHLTTTLDVLQRSPILGEFREIKVARLGILQTASGLGILGILGTLALVYQLGLKSVKEIFKSGSLWWKLLNMLVLVFLAAFLLLPHPALMLWPLAVAASLACGISFPKELGTLEDLGTFKRLGWAVFVGVLVVIIVGSSYGLGRTVWGELKFREALAAANRNEGITTYYALLEAIKRNPYEVRYRLLASQIDIALANSIAASATRGADDETRRVNEEEATPSAGLTPRDQNNILILIQQAVVEGKAAIKLDPENSVLWQNLAAIYRGLVGVAGGAEDWALKSYQRAAELNPKDPNPHLLIGEIHFFSGNFQGAADAFQEAIRRADDFARLAETGESRRARAHYNLAVVYNALNEIDKAIEEIRETLALLPADDPGREQAEKDLEFLKEEAGSLNLPDRQAGGEAGLEGEKTETEELKEATTSAEVQPPPPPVGPEGATESAETKPIEVAP